jgi:hypothetical protein
MFLLSLLCRAGSADSWAGGTSCFLRIQDLELQVPAFPDSVLLFPQDIYYILDTINGFIYTPKVAANQKMTNVAWARRNSLPGLRASLLKGVQVCN